MESRTVGVIGAGNVGANCAHFLCEQELADTIYLYDIDEGRATGKSLDIREALPVRRSRNRVLPCTDADTLAQCSVIVFSLAPAQQPGGEKQSSPDAATAAIIARYAKELAGYRGVIIIDSDDCLEGVSTYLAAAVTPKPHRVIGVGTLPHTLALRAALARAVNLPVTQVQALVGGSEQRPQVIAESLTASGIPLQYFYGDDAQSSSEITRLAKRELQTFHESAHKSFYSHAGAIAEIVSAITSDAKKILTVISIDAGAETGKEDDNGASVPCVIGRDGVVTKVAVEV